MRRYLVQPAFILSLLFTQQLKAQLYKVELDQKIKNSSLIAEGFVIKQTSFWNQQHTMIFTANAIKVYKTFKGELTAKTIEVLTQGGTVANYHIEASDLLKLKTGQTGIFFCNLNDVTITSPASNTILFDVYGSAQGFLKYNLTSNKATAPFAEYKNIEGNLYSLLQQKTGEGMHIIDNSFKLSQQLKGASPVNTNKDPSGITSFTPATINAGTLNDSANNVLTITGTGFGAPSNPKAVLFKDGNNDNETPDYVVEYNSPYIVSWKDKEIKVRVPGQAATGTIGVVTGNGDTTFSSSPLDIFLAVISVEFDINGTQVAKEPRMMNTNTQGGYTLVYSTGTAGNGKNINAAAEKETFQRALTTWKEQVGVNFMEGGTTANQTVNTSDNVNTIMFDNKNTGSPPLSDGVLATTYNGFSMCSNIANAAQKTGFDMVIRNEGFSSGNTLFTKGPCFPVTGEIDLEFVILHELGHAINLAHINDSYQVSNNSYSTLNPSKLMHYSVLDFINRRSLDVSALRSALYELAPQHNTYGNCGLYSSEMEQTSFISVPNDDCPASFPANALSNGTTVNFDLVHTTSNKLTDPQYTAINCLSKGVFVTNNAFYAFKTSAAGEVNIAVSGYATTPSQQSACAGQGVRFALYKVDACPAGQSFPQPIQCGTTNGTQNVVLNNLAANSNYLLYTDGIRNTKATFNAKFTGSALSNTTPPPPEAAITVIFPNPVKDALSINFGDAGKYNINLIDAAGRILLSAAYQINAAGQIEKLSVKKFPAGVYFLRVIDANNNIISKKKVVKLN